jgi:hypothetical protein
MAQQTPAADTIQADTVTLKVERHIPLFTDSTVFINHPFINFTNPVVFPSARKESDGKETMFYSLIALLLFFAFIRNAFPRYLQDLFRSYFRTSMKQRQIREQLMQNPLPSLLLNIFFILCGGFFLTIILPYYGLGTKLDLLYLFLYIMAGLVGAYTLKYVSLKLLGWLFQLKEAADTYIFIVFTTNKIIGIGLIPLIAFLAFANGGAWEVALSLSLLLVGCLVVYRYFLALTTLQRQVKFHFFHFIIYIAAFEIVPLLLINKLLFRFLA